MELFPVGTKVAFGAVFKKDRYYWTGEGEVAATKIPLKLLGRVSKETKSVLNTNYILVKKIKVAAKQNHPLNVSELKLKKGILCNEELGTSVQNGPHTLQGLLDELESVRAFYIDIKSCVGMNVIQEKSSNGSLIKLSKAGGRRPRRDRTGHDKKPKYHDRYDASVQTPTKSEWLARWLRCGKGVTGRGGFGRAGGRVVGARF